VSTIPLLNNNGYCITFVKQKTKIWSWAPDGSLTPRQTGRLIVSLNLTSTSSKLVSNQWVKVSIRSGWGPESKSLRALVRQLVEMHKGSWLIKNCQYKYCVALTVECDYMCCELIEVKLYWVLSELGLDALKKDLY
jgi:hypothetical protein